MPTWLIITLVVVAVIILFIIGLYNSLVKLHTRVKEAWSDIGVQLKRRADLFGNLIETVKASAKFEKGTIENVTKARTGLASALAEKASPAQLAEADSVLNRAINVAVEAYPQLKTTENYGKMMDEISDTEDKIQASRRFYNSGVASFNIKIKTFPNNIFASMLGYKPEELFETKDREDLEKGHDASKSQVNFE